jgi:xanthine dehydrogenase YagS FAD-binding subunit
VRPFSLARPRTLAEAVAAGAGSFLDVRPLAGGTDLLGTLKDGVQTPERLVDLKTLPGLAEIRVEQGDLSIGALATHAALAEHPEAIRRHPALVEAILRAATPQVRNVATIGGGLCQRPRCWYFRHPDYPCRKKGGATCYAQEGENEFHTIFDNGTCCAVHPSNVAPVLLAHDAVVTIHGPDGERDLPLDAFFVDPDDNVMVENVLAPGEVLVRVRVPGSGATRAEAYVEARERQSFDWALAAATAVLRMDGADVREARVVISAVAPRPLRRPEAERLLVGRPGAEAIAAAAERAVEGATPLAQNGYKVPLLRALVRRAVETALARGREG